MHECWTCGEVCDCDGDDTWMDTADPQDCDHECEDEDEEWEELDDD